MTRVFGVLCVFAVAICLVGCGGNSGENMIEDASQDDIAAYEQMVAEEEMQMDNEFTEEQ